MTLRKRILAAATAIALALGMAAGGATPAMAAAPDDTKVWVCKYSGTPGVNEQYKDGKNPIEVSVSTIDDTSDFDPVTGTGYFPDSQGRSYSLGYSTSFTVDPTIEDCPRPELPVPGYTVTDESCESGGSITLTTSEWIVYVVTNAEGEVIPNDALTDLPPGTYTVTPTAIEPAILDDEFYDPLAVIAAIDPALCADLATATIDIAPATCLSGEALNQGGFATTNATLTSANVVDDQYTVVFTADEGSLFAAGDGVSEDRTTLTLTGTLAGPDLTLCALATASIDIAPATCTSGEALNQGGFAMANASLTSSGVVDDQYTVVFTADEGSLFAAGDGVSVDRTTLTLTGTLAGPDLELCPIATAALAFIDPTCDDAQQLDESAFETANASMTMLDVDGSAYTVVFTADGDALFAPGEGVSTDRTTLTFTGTLEPNDERLCLVVEATFTLPPATCEVGEDWENPIIDADAGVIAGEPVFDEEARTVSITFTATAAYIFQVEGEGGTTFSKTLTVTLDVADRDPSLCDEATATVPVIAPTCELGASLDLAGISGVNATFEVVDDGSSDGTYEVLFTAAEGSRFPGDELTLEVTGELADRDPALCGLATASVPVIAPTCELGASLDVDGIEAENATWDVIDDGSESGTYEVEFTADEGYRFPGDQTTLTVSDELAPNDESLCNVVEASFTLPPATCEVGEDWENPIIVADAGVVGGEPAFDPEARTVTITFTATGPNVFVSDAEGEPTYSKTLTLTLDVADRDPSLCLEPTVDWSVTAATCELGESLDLESISADNATVEVIDDGSESGTFEIEFTADDGYRFADDQRILTVTGELAGPNSELCLEAVAAIAVTDATCFLDSTLDEEGFTVENATYDIESYDPVTRAYEVIFTADFGARFDTALDGVSEDGTTRTFSGTLDAADPDGDGCVLPVTDAFLAFTEATCLDAQALDVEGFEFDAELAELVDVTYDGLDYEVVFATLDEDTVFFQSSEPVTGRTVSEDGRTLTFTGTLQGPDEELCLEVILPPVEVIDDCLTQSYTITAVEGVTYTRTVNGVELPVSFGDADSVTYEAVPFDEVTVTAIADPGYRLPDGYEPFTYTYVFDEECIPTAPVTTASVTSTQPDCLGNPGRFTLTNEPGVIWKVDGVVVEGNRTYSAAVGSTPTIEASLEPASEEFPTGFGWNDEDQQTLWNLAFPAADDCLPTLAITGAANALAGLGLVGLIIMMAGTGLVATRRREGVAQG